VNAEMKSATATSLAVPRAEPVYAKAASCGMKMTAPSQLRRRRAYLKIKTKDHAFQLKNHSNPFFGNLLAVIPSTYY